MSYCAHVVLTTAKQVISRRRKNENVCGMSKNKKRTCKACKSIVFHCQIFKFVTFLSRRRRVCVNSLMPSEVRQPCSIESLSMQRFWATDGHWKCTVFLFYSSWHYHIYIFKSLCASRDDYFENLAETNVLACKMFTSGCRPWLKKRCMLKLPNFTSTTPPGTGSPHIRFLCRPFLNTRAERAVR